MQPRKVLGPDHSVFRLWYLLFKLGLAKGRQNRISIEKINKFVERHSK